MPWHFFSAFDLNHDPMHERVNVPGGPFICVVNCMYGFAGVSSVDSRSDYFPKRNECIQYLWKPNIFGRSAFVTRN